MRIGRFNIEFTHRGGVVTDGKYDVGIIQDVKCEEDLSGVTEEYLIHAFYDELSEEEQEKQMAIENYGEGKGEW